jgi:hypothetical protein
MLQAENLQKNGFRMNKINGTSSFIRAWNRLSFLMMANKKEDRRSYPNDPLTPWIQIKWRFKKYEWQTKITSSRMNKMRLQKKTTHEMKNKVMNKNWDINKKTEI